MEYRDMRPARFISRPNRFIAHIEMDGRTETCHVKNTGRCRELLLPGVPLAVQAVESSSRKTKFDLIAVQKGDRLVNIDSQVPNRIFREWVTSSGHFPDLMVLKPESSFRNSRFDFYIRTESQEIMVEVKGVTLEEDGVALFPDAPTERGLKHIADLCSWIEAGHEAYMVFVIQMKDIDYFVPNYATHPDFGQALASAAGRGLKIIALDCEVGFDFITARDFVEVRM
ncbi:MAG: DNA/RNA nuclease SfsA [Syntrophomonadaceae bacterium]|nr:DNA/RNA nuclease SfsA [Syntrophomonadaceae bacterium]